ncbi:serine/threonine-protein kinase BLUS1-like, partial [Trifolium medium]|nr:serine/threonine-protein kinase BLUS1-like [Trifolium medium]
FENENQLSGEKSNRDMRRAPSFSGPLMLPNRASANSFSPVKRAYLVLIFVPPTLARIQRFLR